MSNTLEDFRINNQPVEILDVDSVDPDELLRPSDVGLFTEYPDSESGYVIVTINGRESYYVVDDQGNSSLDIRGVIPASEANEKFGIPEG